MENIKQAGTFTMDLEPNWNEVIQLALECLGSDDKQTRSSGAEMIRGCVGPMSEKGVELWVGQDANVMGGGRHLIGRDYGEICAWANEAISVLSRIAKVEPEFQAEHAGDPGSRAVNFIKLIGMRLEENRQARRARR